MAGTDLQPRPPMSFGEDEDAVTVPGHVRVERYGLRRGRVFIDGQPFPWATSPTVHPAITDADGLVDVTLAIRCSSAEIVYMERPKDGV